MYQDISSSQGEHVEEKRLFTSTNKNTESVPRRSIDTTLGNYIFCGICRRQCHYEFNTVF